MKKLLFISLMLMAGTLFAQTNLTFYNFRTVAQSNMLNPALPARQGLTIGLPSFYNHLYVPGISVFDLFRDDETGQQTLDKILSNDKYNLKNMQFTQELDLFYLGLRVRRNYFSMGVQANINNEMGLPMDLLRMLYFGNTGTMFGKDIKFDDIQLRSSTYAAVHFGYSREFNDRLTIGVRAKYLIGFSDAELLRNVSTLKTDSGTNNALRLTATTDYSMRWAGQNYISPFTDSTLMANSRDSLIQNLMKNPVGSGLAFDLGFNYRITNRWSISGSILNLGYINWKDAKSFEKQGTYAFNGFVTDDPSKIGDSASIAQIQDSIEKVFQPKEGTATSYRRSLGPKIYLGTQFNLYRSGSLGLLGYAESWNGKYYFGGSASFTQRFWRMMDLRVNYNMFRDQKSNIGVGLSMQLPVVGIYFMTDNISGFVSSAGVPQLNLNYTNFRVGLNINLAGRYDKDNDGIPNRKDRCKKIPGSYKMKGCPDSDKDGIADPDDDCIDLPGPISTKGCPDKDNDGVRDQLDSCVNDSGSFKLNGCPDKDNDGVADKNDSCPNDSGAVEFNGCPDRDRDGILDRDDACPDDSGTVATKGCPDADMDSIPDREDECPTEAGKAEFKGCPDNDNDGIINRLDSCVNEAGPASTNGCPDTDKDGIADRYDNCPTEVGTKENNGCPVLDPGLVILTEEEKKVLKEAFSDLEFETGTSRISESSLASLAELAELLAARPEYKLEIAGHTDNVGNAAKNLKLSQDRANAVKAYLSEKGVLAARIKASGFGSKKPVADNKTPEGRQRNRRVEFKIVK